ncbi:MAG: competence protein CoiA family protein [Candidatus Hermodarchaeota archaeon]
MTNLLSTHSAKSESFYHKAIKRLFFKFISDSNKKIIEKSLEKYVNNRRADVYFKLNSGEEIVIEVQNSKISVKEIIERTKHYNNAGMYVLWILYGNGACVASPKSAEDKNDVKISIVENFLFGIYGGRVYYVNLKFYKDKITISPPFALYFSYSSSKKNHRIFRSKYESYYIKNVNYAKISSWNLLCVDYNGYKLARFYDKNIKRILKEKVSAFYHITSENHKTDKKLLKSICNNFKNKYGISLILIAIIELYQDKRIRFNQKIIKKIKRKIPAQPGPSSQIG